MVQLHDATRLHYDVRIESGGVLRSWAVPKGPSMDPGVRRLAIEVDDHTMAAGEFEGVHAGARRGSGAVIVWDEGTVEVLREEPGRLSVALEGRKLAGRFELVRTRGNQWILVKGADGDAQRGSDVARDQPESVRSGRTWQEVAGGGAVS
ncbi:hypothetical protein BH10ACT1_BH10ACT1_05950 [soil metagenome]